MASTYSPNLRLELMANGDQSGTWGATTNTNLGSLLEQAIAGYTTVTPGASNYALTINNGAVDEARSAIITTSVAFGSNTYLPPVPHKFIYANRNTNTKTIYCSTVAGNTTAAGHGTRIIGIKNALLYSDGVNVYNAVSMVDGVDAPTATDNGGMVHITGGKGGSTSGFGGGVAILGGGATAGAGGWVTIAGQSATGLAGAAGGLVSLTGGAGANDATTNGPGGMVTITGGAAGAGAGAGAIGGDIQLTPGVGSGGPARVDFTNASTANGTATVTISNVGPGLTTATISGWIALKVNGTLSYVPYWR